MPGGEWVLAIRLNVLPLSDDVDEEEPEPPPEVPELPAPPPFCAEFEEPLPLPPLEQPARTSNTANNKEALT